MESESREPVRKRPDSMNRRTALAVIFGGVVAFAAAAFGLVAGFLSNALGRTSSRPWIRIGAAEDLSVESFQDYVLRMEHQHAWIQERTPLLVYIKDLYPKDPIALLSTCSHLGCSVKWDGGTERFRCPCHGGVYDAEGTNIEGPPPRPLTRLDVKIEDDVCFVRLPDASGGDASV